LIARLAVDRGEVSVDLSRPLSLAIEIDFTVQVPALGGDAVPSRPLLYPLRAA
jgi:hypothetical protein